MIHVSKVVRNAAAHHTFSLRIISHPSRLLDVFLVFDVINFHFFDVNLLGAIAVSKCLVVARVHRIAAFERTVLWRTLF